MIPRIYYYANCGKMEKIPFGGGEVGNRRTLTLFRKIGYEVVHIEKYSSPRLNNKILNSIIVIAKAFVNMMEFFLILLLGRKKKSIVHIVGFYGQMVYFEFLLIGISKILGFKTVYEMRGGGADVFYRTMGKRYRRKFDKIIRKADFIFSQGMENNPLVHDIDASKHIFYYPNYVMDDFYPSEYPEKPTDKINLIYFGRIAPSKNIDVVISVFANLRRKYDNIYLDIIGNYNDKTYFDKIVELAHTAGISDYVRIHPACDHDRLKEHLRNKHFYIFPTNEPREGHSNAMTEAMAWGLIPISTDHGFNRSVLSFNELIADCMDPICFAEKVEQIVEQGRITEISRFMYERVGRFFTEEKAFMRLKDEYSRLFELI